MKRTAGVYYIQNTEGIKKRIGESSKGRVCSVETKKKMAQAMTGKKLGESHRLNCIKAWTKRKIKED
jgi:hypothetical protein